MLVLTRKKDQQVVIGDNVVVTVISIRGDKVRLGFTAPTDIPVHRLEIYDILQADGETRYVAPAKDAKKGAKSDTSVPDSETGA